MCEALRQACADQGMEKLLNDMELPLAEVLAQMEHTGILVDREGIEAFGKELQTALTGELAAIYEAVGYEFNVNSPKPVSYTHLDTVLLKHSSAGRFIHRLRLS